MPTTEYIEIRKQHFLSLWTYYDALCEKKDRLEEDLREMQLVADLIDTVASDLRRLTAAA